MTRPFFSIVTISFNQAPYLQQCVDSVLSQKGADVQYIVVDPGSTDGSREILAAYGDAIDRLVLEADQGPADGLNKGFAQAAGEVGYFINSDDFLLPGAIDRMRQLWAENAAIDILLGGAWMVNGEGEPLKELVPSAGDLSELLASDARVVQQGLSFRMDRLREVGGFNSSNRTCWDFELICSFLRNGARARVCKERFGAFRIYGESLSGGVGGGAHTQRYLEDLERIHIETLGRASKKSSRLAKIVARARRHLKEPTTSMSIIQDRLFPTRLHRRFNNDLKLSDFANR
jgi:glycosyltransferase involved in cell wall biosynthesis